MTGGCSQSGVLMAAANMFPAYDSSEIVTGSPTVSRSKFLPYVIAFISPES